MLPSQTARSRRSRAHMYRRPSRKRMRWAIALVAVGVACVVGFRWIFATGEPAAAGTAPAQSPAKSSSGDLGQPASGTKNPAVRTAVQGADHPQSMTKGVTQPGPLDHAGAAVDPRATTPSTRQMITMGKERVSQIPNSPLVANGGGPGSNQPPAAQPAGATKAEPPSATDRTAGDASGGGGGKPSHPPSLLAPSGPPAPSSTPLKLPTVSPPGAQRPASNPAASPATPGGRAAEQASDPPAPAGSSSARALQRMQAGMELLRSNKPIEARRMLTEALQTGLVPADAQRVRDELTKLNQRLVFGPEVVPGDPFAMTYAIQSGDLISRLPKKLALSTDWRLIARINSVNPDRVQLGQRLKLIKGPFHAMIDKKDFRLDLYMGDSESRVFVRSFRVGLGAANATPEGVFIVKPNSKLIDPDWVNPRTGEKFTGKDPDNPIGRHWIGLVGQSDNIRGLEGYGIHGTIEPESIGQQRSMGCVRMLADDIALLYELLIDEVSRVEICGEDYQ